MKNSAANQPPKFIWLNHEIIPEAEARLLPSDRGFLLGDGLFETLRSDKGNIHFLNDHIARLRKSAEIFQYNLSEPDWNKITGELLELNGLMDCCARIRITISRGSAVGFGLPMSTQSTILITANHQETLTKNDYRLGWKLSIDLEGFSPPLAAHKTTNYLYLLTARKNAIDSGADEAIILDKDGFVAETSTGSLLLMANGEFFSPESYYSLPGITLEKVGEILRQNGNHHLRKRILPEELERIEAAWVSNSMVGTMPVSAIGQTVLPLAPKTALNRFPYISSEKLFSR